MKNNYGADEHVQRCLNPNCRAILFISGKMDSDTEDRGVDRDIQKKHDEKGDFIECPECGAKHKVKYHPTPPGAGIQWSIDGLRDKK